MLRAPAESSSTGKGWLPHLRCRTLGSSFFGHLEHDPITLAAVTDKNGPEDSAECTAGPVRILQDQRPMWKTVWKSTDERNVDADDRLWAIMDKLVQEQEAQM